MIITVYKNLWLYVLDFWHQAQPLLVDRIGHPCRPICVISCSSGFRDELIEKMPINRCVMSNSTFGRTTSQSATQVVVTCRRWGRSLVIRPPGVVRCYLSLGAFGDGDNSPLPACGGRISDCRSAEAVCAWTYVRWVATLKSRTNCARFL